MPGTLATALSAPLHRLQALLGPGYAAGAGPHPAAVLTGLQERLSAAARSTARTGDQLAGSWSGVGSTAAADFVRHTVAVADQLAGRIGALGEQVGAAAEAVGRARGRLQRLIADFEARADALAADLDTPGTAEQLVDEARRALDGALRVIEDLRAELSAHADTVTRAPTPAAATVPAGFPGGGLSTPGALTSGLGSGLGSGAGLGSGLGAASGQGWGSWAGADFPERPTALPDAAEFGTGVAVQLPDGATALAPNPVAASAVRHALTQLGVPYQWGGTSPGVGLDCSGLTQWAYHEAGLNIPRLAQEQDVGAVVDAASLRPGDLAVWDGHVAMVVGDGLMIEAGDPVQLSAIRTTNAGQGFQGFHRPTG